MLGDGRTGSYLGAIGQGDPGLVLAVEPRWRSKIPPLRSMSLMTSLAVISIV